MNKDLGPGMTYNGITVWSNDQVTRNAVTVMQEPDILPYYEQQLRMLKIIAPKPCIRCGEHTKNRRINFCAGCGKDVRSFWRKLWQSLNLR